MKDIKKDPPLFEAGDKVMFVKDNGYRNEGEVVDVEHFGKSYNYKVEWPQGKEGWYRQGLLTTEKDHPFNVLEAGKWVSIT